MKSTTPDRRNLPAVLGERVAPHHEPLVREGLEHFSGVDVAPRVGDNNFAAGRGKARHVRASGATASAV